VKRLCGGNRAGFAVLATHFQERFGMAIGSISSNTPVQAPAKAAPVESTEATRGGKDVKKDGDADDGASATASTASATTPVINTLGQQIGGNLNVTA
jgi:hypothetical protein